MKVLITLLIFPSFALAQTFSNGQDVFQQNSNVNGNEQIAPQQQMQLQDPGVVTDQPTNLGGIGQGDGSRVRGNQAEDDSGDVNALAIAMAAMFMAQCAAGDPTGCVMAPLAIADAVSSGTQEGQSANFENSLIPGGNGEAQNTTGNLTPQQQQFLDDSRRNLENMGYTINPNGSVTSPEGINYGAEDLGSVDSMVEKGFSAEQAAAIQSNLAETQAAAARHVASIDPKKQKKPGKPAFGDGGDGFSGGAGKDAEAKSGVAVIDPNEGKDKAGLKPGDLAKLSKNFNGTPIGIKFADIFTIVSQKYDSEDKKKAFFKKEY